MSDYTHVFREAGNGFPADGDEVLVADECGSDHCIMRVVERSPIHTSQWEPNYVYLILEDADRQWDDLDDDEAQEAWDDLHHVRLIESTVEE